MGPLDGVKVVEMAGLAPAPFGCMILADLGAEVVRIDRAGAHAGLVTPPGVLDRGRHSIAIDVKSSSGVEAVRDIAAHADVFVEGFRPGVAERLGIGPDVLCEINTALIYGRMTGWGQDGPLAARAGHDINYIAIAGILEPIGRAGQPPHAPQNLLADFAGGGLLLALGVLAALHERSHSGRGQVVDAAMVDGAALLTTFLHGMHANGLWDGERGTNALDGGAPFYDTYRTQDGNFMAVGCVEPHFYAELLDKLGLSGSNLPHQLDSRGWSELKQKFGEVFAQKTRAEWTQIFADSDACVSPVLSPWEAHEHPHNEARRAFVDVGGVLQPAPAPRFSRSQTTDPDPATHSATNTAHILGRWGVAPEIIEAVSSERKTQ